MFNSKGIQNNFSFISVLCEIIEIQRKMEILSVTNKRTQLHKSPLDLSTVCSHEHNQKLNISSDVSFFASNLSPKCFAQVFKSDVVEIWRIKTNNDGVGKFYLLKYVIVLTY